MQTIFGSLVRFGWLAIVLPDKISVKCLFSISNSYISLLVEVFEAVHNIVICLHQVGHLSGKIIRFIFIV